MENKNFNLKNAAVNVFCSNFNIFKLIYLYFGVYSYFLIIGFIKLHQICLNKAILIYNFVTSTNDQK